AHGGHRHHWRGVAADEVGVDVEPADIDHHHLGFRGYGAGEGGPLLDPGPRGGRPQARSSWAQQARSSWAHGSRPPGCQPPWRRRGGLDDAGGAVWTLRRGCTAPAAAQVVALYAVLKANAGDEKAVLRDIADGMQVQP